MTWDSDPSKTVEACPGCVHRESKNAGDSQLLNEDSEGGDNSGPNRLSDHLVVEADNVHQNSASERSQLVLFGCSKLVRFVQGRVELPMRITCYCSHHGENGEVNGFLYVALPH